MKRNSNVFKCFIGVVIFIIVSLFMSQSLINIKGKVTDTENINYCSEERNQDFSNKISAFNETDYLISGETGRVSNPRTVCLSDNKLVILWNDDDSVLRIAKYNSSLDLIINPFILVNCSSLTSEAFELSQPNMLIDTAENLHIFWYIMYFDTPQIGNIYYMKVDTNLQTTILATIIHTYTHSGSGSSCFVDIFTSLFLTEEDVIHLLVEDGTYYLLNLAGSIKASTTVPGELGSVQDLILDSNGDAIILCGTDDDESIFSIEYLIGETSITELTRNVLVNTGDKVIFYTRLIKIENTTYFYWLWENMSTYTFYYESYLMNTNGSLGESGTLNEHFFNGYSLCLNSTHTVFFALEQGIYNPSEFYYSLFHPTENQTYIDSKLMLRILKNDDIFWGPCAFDMKTLLDKNGQLIISYYVNDGSNGYQIHLWKCDLNGTRTSTIVVVAPEQNPEPDPEPNTTTTPVLPGFTLIISTIMIIMLALPELLKRKKCNKTT